MPARIRTKRKTRKKYPIRKKGWDMIGQPSEEYFASSTGDYKRGEDY